MKTQRWTRRDHDRHEILECALISRPSSNESFRAIIVDVSLGGLQVRSQSPVLTGERLTVKIGRDQGSPMFLHADVRYSRLHPDSGLYASGLKFRPESHEERLAIAKYLNSAALSRAQI